MNALESLVGIDKILCNELVNTEKINDAVKKTTKEFKIEK